MSDERPKIFGRNDILSGLGTALAKEFGTLKKETKRANYISNKPRLERCEGDRVHEGNSNSFILFGRDRPGSCGSGKSRGDTHNGALRLTVGHMGHRAAAKNMKGKPIVGHPSNTYDAATLYLSQKADVDTDWLLPTGKAPSSKNRSTAVLKADGVRIVAREGVNIISGVDEMSEAVGAKINSEAYGIQLIARGDDSDMQPLVKGHNLIRALSEMIKHVEALGGIVDAHIQMQTIMNGFMQAHFHVSMLAGPTTTDPGLLQIGVPAINLGLALKCKTGCFFQKINAAGFIQRHLLAGGPGILSLNNYTN
jgi:hypothetical protein